MTKFGELVNTHLPVLIVFYADWNANSVAMSPVISDVAEALGDKARVVKIDLDKNQEIGDALKIIALPTLILYKSGNPIWRQTGEMSAKDLYNFIKDQY